MIYTFGDGFASGHIWPEWPQLIEPILSTTVVNYGHVGAGNEYIFNCAVKSAIQATSDDIFLVQWAGPGRFDKLIEDDNWLDINQQDPVYRNILSTVFGQTWWSTSASELSEIVRYNEFYIQPTQSENQSVLYMIALSLMLESKGIKHRYFSTYPADYSTHGNFKELCLLPWINFPQGMQQWSEKFPDRGNEHQPSPIVHTRWILEKMLPSLDITIDNNAILKVVSNYTFLAYDPDNQTKLNNLKHEINLLFK